LSTKPNLKPGHKVHTVVTLTGMGERRPGVAFVAHCLLNQNSKVGDGAHCAGVYSPIVDVLREQGWRIEQMPCPELAFTGLNRFWAVREQLDTTAYRKHCRRLAVMVADMAAVRAARGEDIVLIGVEGSPSMGVHITSSDPARGGLPQWPEGTSELIDGEGIFIEELRAVLGRRNIEAGLGGETHALPGHNELTQRTRLELLLADPPGSAREEIPAEAAE
jgi:predicted secreted protein